MNPWQFMIPEDQRLILWKFAKAQNAHDQKLGMPERKVCKEDGDLVKYRGFRGEWVVCELFGIPMPQPIHDKAMPEYDLTTPWGVKLEVKTTQWPQGRLLTWDLERWKTSKADAFVLVIDEASGKKAPRDTPLRIAGWIKKEEAVAKCSRKDLGYGLHYVIEQKDLQPCPF